MKKNNENQLWNTKGMWSRKSYAEVIKNHNKHEKEIERSNVLKTKCTDFKRLEKSQTHTNITKDKKLTKKHQETKWKMQKDKQIFEIPKNFKVEKLKRNKTKEHQQVTRRTAQQTTKKWKEKYHLITHLRERKRYF